METFSITKTNDFNFDLEHHSWAKGIVFPGGTGRRFHPYTRKKFVEELSLELQKMYETARKKDKG